MPRTKLLSPPAPAAPIDQPVTVVRFVYVDKIDHTKDHAVIKYPRRGDPIGRAHRQAREGQLISL
ncbi:hypothetical protein [Mycobacteroides abscessus]|uniref:hypothetical protein n=1 Tax=Mycobacteroides abscessus TaxID=36809 RepID=UPI001300027F|nr:hypothetical protein [Mycobacteroides abscessus]